MGSRFCSFQCYQQPLLDWAGSGGGRFVFPAIPIKWGNASARPGGVGGRRQGGGRGNPPEPHRSSPVRSGGARPPAPERAPRRAARALPPPHASRLCCRGRGARTPAPAPLCPLPSPTPSSPCAWIRYVPSALPDVSIPSSPDRAIIYQVVSRVVGEGGPGGRGFVSSLCWSSTGPSSLVSSQLLRVAGVREQMLKGLPFICRLILLPFHFILPASGMLLAYTPPHPPRYHSACMFLREQELIFHVLVSSPRLSSFSCHQPTHPPGGFFTAGLFLVLECKIP